MDAAVARLRDHLVPEGPVDCLEVVTASLESLVVLLRDPPNRDNESLQAALPVVVRTVLALLESDSASDEFLSLLLKVIINLTADHPKNANIAFAHQKDHLWRATGKHLRTTSAVNRILVVLVTNALRLALEGATTYPSPDLLGLLGPMIEYTQAQRATDLDALDSEYECLEGLTALLAESTAPLLVETELYGLAAILEAGVDICLAQGESSDTRSSDDSMNDPTEGLNRLATALYSVAASLNLKVGAAEGSTFTQARLFAIARKLALVPNTTAASRSVFASIGLVSSLASNPAVPEISLAVRVIVTGKGVPYAAAAACIVIGNYITSSERKQLFLNTLLPTPEPFMDALLDRFSEFSDLVQFQAIHLVRFLITDGLLLQKVFECHWSAFYRATKIISDNRQYYPTVASQLLMVLVNLIRGLDNSQWTKVLVSDVIQGSMMALIADEAFPEASLVELALLSKLVGLSMSPNPTLMAAVMQFPRAGSVPSTLVMARIKALVDVLAVQPALVVESDSLLGFVIHLRQIVGTNGNDAQVGEHKVLVNNSRFFGAKVLEHLSPSADSLLQGELEALLRLIPPAE